jgi:ankyrin repeat protein
LIRKGASLGVLVASILLVASSSTVLCRASQGTSHRPFEEALRSGDIAAIRDVVENGADVNAAFLDWNADRALLGGDLLVKTPPLLLAAEVSAEAVEILLDAGADINSRCFPHGCTALIEAARAAKPEILHLLLARGADVGAIGQHEMTALETSAYVGSAAGTLILFDALQATVNAEKIIARAMGHAKAGPGPRYTEIRVFESWLEERAGNTSPDIIRAARMPSSCEQLRSALKAATDVDARDSAGWTPLLWASGLRGSSEKVALLLEAGANPNLPTAQGWTPLMAAAESSRTKSVDLLLRAGADVNATESGEGLSPLHLAALHGSAGMVELMLSSGADCRLKTKSGRLAESFAHAPAALDGDEIAAILKKRYDLDPLSEADIELVVTDELRDETIRRVRARDWRISESTDGVCLKGELVISNPPIDLVFEAQVIVNGSSFEAGSICARMGTVLSHKLSCVVSRRDFSEIDINLLPSPRVALGCLKANRIYGGEIRLNGVRVKN